MIVIGFQVLCWLAMVVAVSSGLDWVNLDKLEKFATPLVVVGIGLAYIFTNISIGIWPRKDSPSPVKISIADVRPRAS